LNTMAELPTDGLHRRRDGGGGGGSGGGSFEGGRRAHGIRARRDGSGQPRSRSGERRPAPPSALETIALWLFRALVVGRGRCRLTPGSEEEAKRGERKGEGEVNMTNRFQTLLSVSSTCAPTSWASYSPWSFRRSRALRWRRAARRYNTEDNTPPRNSCCAGGCMSTPRSARPRFC